MDVIVEGMVTDVRFPHRANKPAGMLLHPLGMSTAFYSVSWHLYSQFQEIDNSQQLIIHVIMKKLLTLFAATVIGLLQSHATDVTPVLSPAPTDEVTNLATIKVTFNGLEMLTTPYLSDVNATLTNTTSGKKYVCVGVKTGGWKAPNEVTLSFGLEGTTEALGEIKEDGTYKLSIAANSFKSEIENPTYYSPLIEATYTIGGDVKDSMSDYTLTPGTGNVTEISSIKVDFPGTGFMGISIVSLDGITLTYINPRGTVSRVAKVVKNEYNMGSFCTLMFNWEGSELKEPLTFIEPGTYTLDIPAGAFSEFYATPKNRHITATYTIVANGGAMSTCQITPAAGNVDKIETIKLNFGGNEVSSLEFADDISDITIVRRGEFTGEWYSASFNPAIETLFTIGNGTSALDTIEDAFGDIDVATLLNDALRPVYNLQGIMVRYAGDNAPLPAGLYIVAGHKIVIK